MCVYDASLVFMSVEVNVCILWQFSVLHSACLAVC